MRSPGATTRSGPNMADYLPRYSSGAAVTLTASEAITGGRLVSVTGNRLVAQASADSAAVVGVAGYDAQAGDTVTIYTRPSGVHSLTASGAIEAGAKVISATAGKVATITTGTETGVNPIGIALQPAADLDVVDVLFT